MGNVIKVLGDKNDGRSTTHIPNSFFYSGNNKTGISSLDEILEGRFLVDKKFPSFRFDGAWATKDTWLNDSLRVFKMSNISDKWLNGNSVIDQRTGLGTPRPPEPRRCLEFNGTNQYGWIPIDPVTEFPFALFGWVNKTDVALDGLVGVGSSSNAAKYLTVLVDEGNRVQVSRRNTTAYDTQITTNGLSGQWRSVVVVFESNTAFSVYENGVLISSQTGLDSVLLDSGFDRFFIGALRTPSPTNYLDGKLMHCGYIRRAGTLSDAQTFHSTGIIPDAEGLFLLDENSTTVSYNIGTEGGEMTIVNGAAGMLYEGRDVPFSRQNEVGFSEPFNLLDNPEWSGATSGTPGDLPTGWSLVTPPGTSQTTVTEVDGFNSVRFQTESSRLCFTQVRNLDANSTYSFTARIKNNIPIELLQLINGVTIPSGATQTYYLNGIQVSAITELSVGNQDIEVRIQTAGSGGTASIRFGVGTTASRTGDAEISRPVFAKASRMDEKIPLLLSNSQIAADGNPATYTGKAHFDGTLEQSNCLTFDGVDDYISVPSLSGSETVVSSGGTSTITIAAGRINGTAGTCWNILLSNGDRYICSEGSGSTIHNVTANARHGTIVNGQASNWETKQDVYHYNITKGVTVVDIVPDGEKIDKLFESDEQGAVYDAYDLSTLFQDPAGTQPVTASGQTVGLHLDKSKGLVPGPELVTNGDFLTTDNWTLAAGSGGSAVISGGLLTLSGPNTSFPSATQSGILTANRWYRVIVNTTSNITAGSLGIRIGGVATQYTGFSTAGTYNLTIFSDGSDLRIIRNSGYVDTAIIDNISVRELPGNHRYQTSAPSRPQYNEDGSLRYLLYDGIDDFMETNEVDFTGTNKMTVWWGGRKLSAIGTASGVYGLTANPLISPGSFELQAPTGGTVEYQISSVGTIRSTAVTESFPAPDTAVITQISDIAAPSIVLRRNGSSIATTTSSQGTGSYANAKLYFGRRGGITVSANIREYMTIIRGAETELRTIETIENLVARKTGIAEPHYEDKLRVPASETNPGFDALGNPLTNPAIVGINGAETEINFSPVDNSWPEQYSIPGADLPNYTFDGDPGDIVIRKNTTKHESNFTLEKQ